MKYNYFIIPLLTIMVAMAGRMLIKAPESWIWYKSLTLPRITPPDWVFAVVWNIIFIGACMAAIIVWNGFVRNGHFWAIIGLFTVNAMVNILWSYLFFNKHLIGAALIDAIVLEITTLALMALISIYSLGTGLLLLPYSLWGLFTIYLNYLIWLAH